jgi:hypothetical protein
MSSETAKCKHCNSKMPKYKNPAKTRLRTYCSAKCSRDFRRREMGAMFNPQNKG